MNYYTLTYELPEQTKSEKIKAFEHKCQTAGIAIPTDVRSAYDKHLALEVELKQVLNSEGFSSGYSSLARFVGGDTHACTWYRYKEDMLKLSSRFPTVLFMIQGSGEDSDDIWRHYFLNGKSQRCEAFLVFEDFNPELLK